jgi:hypothetical protein
LGLKKTIILVLTIAISNIILAQSNATLYGNVSDAKKNPLELVTISVYGKAEHTVSNKFGNYELSVPSNLNLMVLVTFVGYATDTLNIFLKPDEKKEINCSLYPSSTEMPVLNVTDNKGFSGNFVKIDPHTVNEIPSVTEGVESIIKTLPGVSSNNELSSQYNVRGGNYDENLVYVNDIEVYRPFLVSSGQQEGLSFINSDLVSGIQFSSGGFDAKYGDKMSSVLDIQYKKPKQFGGSVSGSLLGFSAHLEGVSKNTRISYLIGVRQKSNSYLLKSLDTKGDYKPSFTDVQTEWNYFVNEKFNIDFLGNYARNSYKLIPQSRQTDFGTLNDAIRLSIYFDGQELDRFDTYFGAFSGNYSPRKNVNLKFITSAFQTNESETYDVQGEYYLDQLETDMGKDQFGHVAFNLGTGAFLNHARDYLNANVFNAEHKGTIIGKKLVQYWGVQYQREYFNYQLSEWQMIDSAGYTLPHSSDSVGYVNSNVQPNNPLEMQNVVKAQNIITSNQYSGYYQQKWIFDTDSTAMSLTAGVRSNYLDMNQQLLVSPRATFSYKPNWKNVYIFRFSTGYYSQPPFYKELIDFNGNINEQLKAQTSIHFVLSAQKDFTAWGRPFHYTTETYYKILKDLVPYEIDDVKIRYYAKNMAHGYAAGIDMKVNGEFVPGIESWASVSVMKTMEDIEGDYYYDYFNKEGEQIISGYTADQIKSDSIRHVPGYIPRPTDQRVNFALFFQDFLPKHPTYKMHLSLIYGSGLPFGPPSLNTRYKDTLRIPAYRRVDIGFSKELKGENTKLKPNNPFRFFKTIWITLDVFNLLQINNTISYIWVTDVTGRQYAVPNYLTPRQLNLKLIMQF